MFLMFPCVVARDSATDAGRSEVPTRSRSLLFLGQSLNIRFSHLTVDSQHHQHGEEENSPQW